MGSKRRFKRSMYGRGCPVYCAWCAEPVPQEEATADHVLPKWRGGSNRMENLVIACEPCNSQRGRDDLTVFFDLPQPPYWEDRVADRTGQVS